MWTGSKKDLENLLNELNQNTHRLNLNAKYPKEEFLFYAQKYIIKTTNYYQDI